MGLNTSPPKDEEKTYKEFDNVKKIVVRFLKDLPETRNSDILLYYEILKETFLETDLKDNIPKALFLDTLWKLINLAPDKSTMVRVRRLIQNGDCVFEPTDPDVRKKRKIRSEDISEWSVDGDS
mgnify:FL=1|tara:strand:+ start:168 stop:539 length:372 start_codon:yes stop_codon:yes gene_type:complete